MSTQNQDSSTFVETFKKSQVKLPAGISMLLRQFGIDPEMISKLANELLDKGNSLMESGTLDKIFSVLSQLERLEKKIDYIGERLYSDYKEKSSNGEFN